MSKIDITSSLVEKSIESVTGFLSKLIKPAVEEVGLLITDKIRFFRFKNQIDLLERAELYVNKKNISLKAIPVKTLFPLLEGASLEEDEGIKEMWVGLLVNYVDTSKIFSSSVFPHILTQISTTEAKFLNFHYKKIKNNPGTYIPIDMKLIDPDTRINDAELGNLIRLGLIEIQHPRFTQSSILTGLMNIKIYLMSSLCLEFMQACQLEE